MLLREKGDNMCEEEKNTRMMKNYLFGYDKTLTAEIMKNGLKMSCVGNEMASNRMKLMKMTQWHV